MSQALQAMTGGRPGARTTAAVTATAASASGKQEAAR